MNSSASSASHTARGDDLVSLRAGLYEFASCLMRAPLDGLTTADVVEGSDARIVKKMADVYGYTDLGGAPEDRMTPESFLIRHVCYVLGISQIDLAVEARRLADAL